MRLKQLELHGYKTFADKTRFVFNGGLTAIIGPNGSGKSNIADAVQWVLGEQSYTLLRAKRSEDMIFSGSNQRPRMGMAQVRITLDNADGWLPVDYSEVVISRRAFRSGENEYYLNGTRVRLRDITDLLSHSGLAKRTYTVIGQGLVDRALSLRPEERRALIEEAAGIAGYQAKRDRALNQLDETRRNLDRVRDIIQEIEPRLRYLKGQARRAEERLRVQAELDSRLRVWYGYRWQRALEELRQARQREADARLVVEARREALRRLTEADAELRQRYTTLRTNLGDWHRESSHLHRQAEVVQRELAVGSERLRQLEERRQDLLHELTPLREHLQAQSQRVQATADALAAEQERLQALQAVIEETQARLNRVMAERDRHEERLRAAQRRHAELQQEASTLERRLVELDSRRHTLEEERRRLKDALVTVQANQAELTPQLEAQQARLYELQDAARQLSKQRERVRQAISQGEAELAGLGEQLAQRQRAADRLHDQLDMLQRLKEEGEGYRGGTRSIIRAISTSAASHPLSGIVGTVADQIEVPADLELAIETALGSRLQDIVVERWQDAERAIAWLKRTRGGRATFLPLDTLRPGRPIRPPALPGVVGLGSELVKAPPRLRPVVHYLLNRVVVVKDLSTARRVLDAANERPTVVTLEGDIVRPGGSVSGGSQSGRRDQGVLARERALRELPQRLAQAQQEVAELQVRQRKLQEQLQEQRTRLAMLDQRLANLAREEQLCSAALARLEGQAAQIARELAERQQRLSAADREHEAVCEQTRLAQERLQVLGEEIAAAEQTMAEAEAAMARVDTSDLTADLMARKADASVFGARVSSQQEMLANQQRIWRQIQHDIEQKERRIAALAQEHQELEARVQGLRQEESRLSAQIEDYARRIEPAEAELATLEAERSRLTEQEAEHRQYLEQEEQAHHQAQLAYQRAEDRLAHLRSEIEHDVGLVELPPDEAQDDQPLLPLRPLVERLPVVDVLPENIEQEIRELRARYSRLGSVNPNAPEEYANTLERYEFLTSQAADLEEAAGKLKEVIQELNEVMQRKFMSTFRAVAREFRDQFTRLFGGGTARLRLSEPNDPMHSGVEIVVRPPGKRVQPLPLLSGGERSLTAAALILSILRVNPPPFCILDEVDAALDEANVERFRVALREAAQQTQFIVITHNRGTIEAADTIYGISMGSDSVSQALSLRLEDLNGHEAGRRDGVARREGGK